MHAVLCVFIASPFVTSVARHLPCSPSMSLNGRWSMEGGRFRGSMGVGRGWPLAASAAASASAASASDQFDLTGPWSMEGGRFHRVHGGSRLAGRFRKKRWRRQFRAGRKLDLAARHARAGRWWAWQVTLYQHRWRVNHSYHATLKFGGMARFSSTAWKRALHILDEKLAVNRVAVGRWRRCNRNAKHYPVRLLGLSVMPLWGFGWDHNAAENNYISSSSSSYVDDDPSVPSPTLSYDEDWGPPWCEHCGEEDHRITTCPCLE